MLPETRTCAPEEAAGVALTEARKIAGPRAVRAVHWSRITTLGDLRGAGAVIVNLDPGFAIHRTCSRGVGAIACRIYIQPEVT